jgi:putative protease
MTDDELFEVIDYGNETGKDIRIAINVMPSPSEIADFLKKVETLVGRGATGVMICDPGCIRLVHERLPETEIHVSVTAGIFNAQDITFYREMGAEHIVIPYRWGVPEINEIKNQTDVELEAFIFQTSHRGRICPGRCCWSSYFHAEHAIGDDQRDLFVGSASRGGSCYRMCRETWNITVDEESSKVPHLKSSPELLLWEIPQYIEMGVARFKIPGRERSADLVCEVVKFYRRLIDHVQSGNDDVSVFFDDWESIKSAWRGERVKRDAGRIKAAMTPPGHRQQIH